jgi:TPR repeat protein
MGDPEASYTLFTGALLSVLRKGAVGLPPLLSFAHVREEAEVEMRYLSTSQGRDAQRPALHTLDERIGDLKRIPAFRNPANPGTARRRGIDKSSKALERRGADQDAANRSPPDPSLALSTQAIPAVGFQATTKVALHEKATEPRTDLLLAVEHQRQGKLVEAARHYLPAADGGDAEAQCRLGWLYEYGRGGMPKDERRAAGLYGKAAEQGHAEARYRLGLFRQYGRAGFPPDEYEAGRLYRLAAEQGEANAQVQLGWFWQNGLGGFSKRPQEAARLYRLAAQQGVADAQEKLGCLYEQGLGLPRDMNAALTWYGMAARGGSVSAKDRLRQLRQTG